MKFRKNNVYLHGINFYEGLKSEMKRNSYHLYGIINKHIV